MILDVQDFEQIQEWEVIKADIPIDTWCLLVVGLHLSLAFDKHWPGEETPQ